MQFAITKTKLLTMKLLYFLLIILLSCNNNSNLNNIATTLDEKKETQAIMQVIDNETKCFFDGNYECWSKNWIHEKYAVQSWNNSDGSIDVAVGWDSINAQGKRWIEQNYASGKNIVHPFIKKTDMQVKFFDSTYAYLFWKQLNADKEKKNYNISHETRIMQKQPDGWKIVNVTALWDSKNTIPVSE